MSEYITLIDRYGLSTTILLVLLFAILIPWLKMKLGLRKVQEPKNELVSKENANVYMRIDGEINAILSEMMTKYCADRAILFQMHNGLHSIASVPFLRVSATHERIGPNIQSHINMLQNLLTTTIFDEAMFGREVFDSAEDPFVNTTSIMMANSLGVKRLFIITLKDMHGSLVGAITMSYQDNQDCPTVVNKEEFVGYANRIAICLSSLAERRKNNAISNYRKS